LVDACERCVGIDINEEAVNFVRDELQFEDVYMCDILKDDITAIIGDDRFDYLILGEVLEHTDDPVNFLATLAAKTSGRVGRYLITVPNAFSFANLQSTWKSREYINSDHRYWFTPYTLAKVTARAGLEVEELGLCGPPFHRSAFVRFALRGRQLFSESIYAVVTMNEKYAG
jgi:2-polyprenyl-3-methyl-5-hydroxy-6-metoxy-1,4-benzoquinol methylase